MKVLVTGAHGRTGKPVVKALSAKGASVIAFVRDSAQEAEMTALGASGIAVGDMDDPTIAPAVAGCDVIVHIGPPMHPDEKTMTSHFIQAAKDAGLSKFVYYSVMHPLRREVRHHSLKLDTEELLIESGMPYSIVQPMRYMQHLEPIWKKVMEEQCLLIQKSNSTLLIFLTLPWQPPTSRWMMAGCMEPMNWPDLRRSARQIWQG